MVKNCKEASVFLSGLIFGTGSSIFSKALFDMTSEGKKFEKPLFQTTMMFVGMLLALPVHFFLNRNNGQERSNSGDVYERLDDGSNETESRDDDNQKSDSGLSLKTAIVLIVPSLFDLVATALANIGLVMIEVSVYQLMKCTVIIFVALLKSKVLKIKLERYMWIGVAINMLAVCIVASTSFFPSAGAEAGDEATSQSGSQGLGIVFIVLSCLVQSGQYVYEEKVMDESSGGFAPLIVVGMEGFWGLLFSVLFVLPLAANIPGNDCPINNGTCVYEDSIDTWEMLKNSNAIIFLTVAYVFIITGYNAAAVYVTFLLDSVWHAILDNFRPISVWMTQLVLFQLFNGKLGEKWVTSSWLQLAGLIVLLLGTAVYNGNLKLPGIHYDDKKTLAAFHSTTLSASPFLQSPGARRLHLQTVEGLGFAGDEESASTRDRSASMQHY